MPLEKLANNAVTTISGSMNGSSDPVTFTVASAADFPIAGNFHVIIDDEILLVTTVSGTSFTATRAQESTTIASHTSGANVALIFTSASIKKLIQQYSRPYPTFEPAGVDDEFDDANFSGWTTVQGTPNVTVTEAESLLSIQHPGGGSAAQFNAFMKADTVSVGDSIEMCFRTLGWDENFMMVGLIMADGATYGSGEQMIFLISPQQSLVFMTNNSNYNSNNSNTTVGIRFGGSGYVFLRLTMTATNTFKGEISCDGVTWMTMASGYSRTITPTHVGFGITKWGGANPMMASVEYFKKRP